MERAHDIFGGTVGRMLFVATLWMALATALLCAMLPTGLPLTKSVGSAFSPYTTEVALRTKSAPIAPKRVASRDQSGPATILTLPLDNHGAPLPDIAALPPLGPQLRLPPAVGGPEFALSSAPSRSSYPRGPPSP